MVAHVFLIDKIRLMQIIVNCIVNTPSLLSLHSYEHKILMILYIVTFFQISDYEMVQLEHSTKLCHTRNKHKYYQAILTIKLDINLVGVCHQKHSQ